jgi:hypothetical protein
MRVVPPRVVKPGLPAGIDQICMKALAHDPRDRFASMKALADALMDERFANGWREGASDLAQLIRESTGAAEPAPERRTQHTDRPVTIVTRSLISQSKPAAPDVSAWSEPIPTRPSTPRVMRAEPDSLEKTSERRVSRGSIPQLVPQLVPAPGPALGWMEAPAPVTPAEMASVHGGSTVTGSAQISLAEKGSRWQVGVLGVAALLGIGAAIAIQLAPDHANKASAEPIAAVQHTVQPPAVQPPTQPSPTIVQVPVPVPVETPAPPAPAPVVAAPPVAAAPVDEPKPALAYKARVTKPVEKPHKAEPKKADATLRMTADRTAAVTIGHDQQYIPGGKFHLAGGDYTVRISSDDGDFKAFSCSISVPASRVSILDIYTEDHSCFVK